MWRLRRRVRRLEGELAEARASQAELRRRLEFFEMIAAATGAAARPVPSAPMPPPLMAAARELHRQDVPVRLDIAGAEVIAVIGGEGDPREWWTAIWELTGQAGDVVIRVSHVSLPAGLNALARRGPAGEPILYVSDVLPPDRQRAVVRLALRASRRPGWRAVLPAPPAAVLLASGITWLRRAALALRAHAVAWGTASAVLAAASTAVYFAAVPHQHVPAGSAAPPAPAVSRSPAGLPAQPGTTPGAQPPARASAGAPQGGPRPLATVAVRRTPVPAPAPGGSPSPAPVPSVSPAPQPSPAPTVRVRHCITVLGIRTCLRVAL